MWQRMFPGVDYFKHVPVRIGIPPINVKKAPVPLHNQENISIY
jgi:hypothetical protein